MQPPGRSKLLPLARKLLHLGSSAPNEQQILVLAFTPALGYGVHMTPVYEALQRGGRTVIVATHPANCDLLRHSPHIDHLLAIPDPQHSFFAAVRSLRGKLQQRKLAPGWILTGPQDARTRIGLLGALACAGRLGGFAVDSALYDRPLTYDRTLSRVANNLRLAELFACDTTSCEPRVFFSAAQAESARRMLPASPVLVVVAGNSGGLPTAWHDERWAEVIRHAQRSYRVVYVGTARDQAVLDRIQALAGGSSTSLAGRTSLGELAAVLAQADLCLSLMTGALHVARAVGTPVIALGLAWEPPLEWMSPPKANVRILRGPDAPRRPDDRLDDLTAEQVVAALDNMRRLYPPSAEARAERTAHSSSGIDHGAPVVLL